MSSNACGFLCGLAFGAALMYFLDPQGGRRRRTLVQDKATSWANQAERYAEKATRDMGNRAAGAVHEARKAVGIPT